MTTEKKLALLEEAWDLDAGALRADMALEELDEYDSMAKLSLVVLMDEEFGKKLDGDGVRKLKTVADILAIMEA